MRKNFILFFCCIVFSRLISQENQPAPEKLGFEAGDIVISPNIGYPQVNAFVIKTAINGYYKYIATDPTTTFDVSHRGVFNAKIEYGALQQLGLGFAASYWDLDVRIQNNYSSNGTDYTDQIDLNLEVLALGIRGNYHFVEDIRTHLLDPYVGFTIGATKYSKSLVYTTTNPNREIPEWVPERLYKIKDSWATYISSTIGVRFYPVKNIGLNAEFGWDKGALLFGGIVFRFHTPPIKSWQD